MTDPIVPIIGGQRPETELQRAAREAQNARVRHSLQIALTRDPNKVAERVNLNAASTVDDYIVAEEKRRQDIIRVTGKTEMSPVTAQWLSNPDYANISWQDTDALTKVEKLSVGGVLKELAGGTMTFAAGALSAVAAFPERLIDAFRTAGYSPPEFRRMLLEDLQRQGLTGRQLKRIEQQITPQTQEEWIAEGGVFPAISSFLRSVGQGAQATQFYAEQFLTDVKTPLKELLDEGGVDPSSTTAAIYGGFRSLPAMLAVAPLYPVLGVHGAGAAFVVPLYGNSINRARLEGMSEQAAHTYALGQAGIEYLTNIVPGGKFLAGMKLKSPLLQRIKDQLPAELVQENIATAAQDLLDMAALEPDKTFEEYLRERPERAWHTIVATTVGVASLNTTIRVAEQLTTRIDTEEQITKSNGDFVQGVIDNLRDTNLAKQSPQKAAEFVNLASQITGRDVARIDSEVLGQILAESEDRDDFLAEFPSIGQQLNQNGADPGSEVELPTGDFVARMALSEKYQDIASKMQPNLRIGNAEFSLAEESQIEEERQRIREQTEEQMQQSLESEERQADQRQVILKELRDFAAQMPGITKKQASSAAEIAVTSWESLARAFNMEVGELWDLHKPVLTAGQITIPELGGQGILSQPVTPKADAAYMEAVKAGDVKAQQAAVNRAAGVPDVFDAKDGYGAVSNNQEVDYRGFRAFLTPEQFRSLVPPGVSGESTRSFISEKLSSGEKIGQPFLLVDWDKENGVWRVSNHEGRSRSDAFADVFGQQPMEVHFFPLNARAESITPEMRVAPIIGQEGVGRLQLSSEMDARAITRDADGNVIPLSRRFNVEQPSILYAPHPSGSRVTPAQDAAYMEAVKAGDVEAQQAAVADAARSAGFTVELFHGTEKKFDVFDRGSHFGSTQEAAVDRLDFRGVPEADRKVVRVLAKIERPFRLTDSEVNSMPALLRAVREGKYPELAPFANEEGIYSPVDLIRAAGFDAVVYENTIEDRGVDSYMIVDPGSVKSADPITRDADGNIIPLSQRFDVDQPSILYAPEADDTQRRGAYLPRSMEIILSEKADATTLIHEFIHHYLHTLSLLAHNQDAPEAVTSQFQTLLDWFGVEDLAAWDALPASEKAVHHEAFTYNFEIYLGTGKAPTKRLEKVFAKVAKWMRGIYGKIRGALSSAYEKEFPGRKLPVLTPSVIEVFDTMMGAEAEVATAAADMQMIPVFQTQEESAMSDEEWEAYNLGAELHIDQATAKLTATTARAMRWLDNAMARVIRAKNKTAKEQRKAIREGIQAEVESRPVYRAINMLRRGVFVDEQGNERQVPKPYRLDAARVQELFPAKEGEAGYLDLSPLRTGRYGMVVKNGLDPAVVAEQFGFASAAELVKELVAARPINDVINELTDEEIKERHPELKPEAIKQAAMESLHNEALAKFVSKELQFLGGINKPVRVIMEAARREAEAEVAQMSHRNIKPAKFLAAERRAAKTAQQWMAKGDRRATAEQSKALSQARKALKAAKETQDADIIAAAEQDVKQAQQAMMDALGEINKQPGRATVNAVVRAKWNQLYQGMLYREAIAARKRFDKHERYLRRMSKDTKRKKIGADHSDQIDYILSRLNIRKVSAQAAQRMQDQRVRFQQWLKDQQQSGMDYGISDEMLSIAAERPIQDIPMDSLDGIVDAIEQIYHAGDRIQNARLMQLNKKLAEIKTELIGNVESNSGKIKPSNVTPNTVLGRMKKSFHSFFIRHIKTSTKAYVMDGGELGAFWNFIIRPANRQMGVEQQEVAEITERLQMMMQPFYERGTMTADSGAVMPRRKFDTKSGEWQDDAGRTPRSLTREEVFILALDLGNESNIQRVTDGFGITQEEAMQMVSVLTPEELRVVGQIWDLFAEFKPRISEMERRLNGKEPTYLTPKPIAFRANDGSLVELNGGYLPIKYDRSASELGTSIEAATQARMQLEGSFVGNQTRDTYKKTRVARVFNRPLLLQTSRLFNGLNEVIHDLAWREYLVDANLILRPDGSVSRAIIDNYGSEWMADIRQWMKDIAASGPGPQHPAEQWLGLMRRFISVSRLGFSPVTAALQQTGTVISAQSIGAKHVGDATIRFLSDVVGTHKEMLDKSPEMRNRHRTRFRELGEVAAQIRGKPEKIMALERGAYAMIMYSQMVPDTITWHAAYSRAFEDNPGISDKEAADRAYQAVLDTQGSGDLVNLSTIERGGPGSKLLTVFYTWQNTLFNEIYRIAKTEGLSAEGVARLATLAVVLPFLTVVIRDLAPDDEEEKKKRRTGKGAMSVAEQYAWETLRESINTLLGTTVGFREVAPTIASVLSGQRAFEYRGPAGFAPIVDFVGTINAAAESGVQSRRFWRQFTNFVGDVAGVPSTQINRTVDGVLALSEGKDVPWWAVVLGTQK